MSCSEHWRMPTMMTDLHDVRIRRDLWLPEPWEDKSTKLHRLLQIYSDYFMSPRNSLYSYQLWGFGLTQVIVVMSSRPFLSLFPFCICWSKKGWDTRLNSVPIFSQVLVVEFAGLWMELCVCLTALFKISLNERRQVIAFNIPPSSALLTMQMKFHKQASVMLIINWPDGHMCGHHFPQGSASRLSIYEAAAHTYMLKGSCMIPNHGTSLLCCHFH